MARPSRIPGTVHPAPPGKARMYEQAAARPHHVAQGQLTSAASIDPGPYGPRAEVVRLP